LEPFHARFEYTHGVIARFGVGDNHQAPVDVCLLLVERLDLLSDGIAMVVGSFCGLFKCFLRFN
jgi:hypothetical protein